MHPEIAKLIEKYNSKEKYFFELCYGIAQKAHKNDVRGKNGKPESPYIGHVDQVILRTYKRVKDLYSDRYIDICIAIAALHDVEEDHPMEYGRGLYIDLFETLRGTTADKDPDIFNVVDGADAITKRPKGFNNGKGERYHDYVQRVRSHKWATIVKLADLEHNMEDLDRGQLLQKYELTKYVLEMPTNYRRESYI